MFSWLLGGRGSVLILLGALGVSAALFPLWAMIVMKATTEALKLWLVLQAVTVAHRLLVG